MTSSHLFHGQAKSSRGDKLSRMTGERGEYPPDKASRLVGTHTGGQGDSSLDAMDKGFAPAAARQVSNTGEVKGEDD